MYRLLEVGEVIDNGDEFWDGNNNWKLFWCCFGMKVTPQSAPIRRKMPETTKPAANWPDPGEGWRLLGRDEPVEVGDECWIGGNWKPSGNWTDDGAQSSCCQPYRRRVVSAQPASEPAEKFSPRSVSVGDRVKVLSGPWAGCTGVVIEFEAVVLLDNVYVGGDQLIVFTNDVETVPVIWRELEIGEVIREGDQYWTFGCGPWEAVDALCGLAGGTVSMLNAKHRRPVRIQSLDWRYLDAGETVKEGDETAFSCEPIWRPALDHFFVGYRVQKWDNEHSETFRRKLPANPGG